MNFRLTAILFGTIFVLAVVLLILSFSDDKPATDLLAEELVAVKPADVDTLEIEREGGARVKIVRAENDKDRWNLVEPVTAPADVAAVNDVVSNLLRAKPTAFTGLSSNPAAHGLQPPGLRVTLRAGDKSSTINIGDVTTGGGRGVAFVTTSARPGRPMAVPRSSVEPLFRENTSGRAADLAKGANDYRDRAVFAADTRGAGDDVDAVTIAARGKTLSLARGAGAVWKFVSPAELGDADPAGDPNAPPGKLTGVRPLLAFLTSMQAASAADFVDAPDLAKLGLEDASPDLVRVELRTRTGVTTTAFLGNRDEPTPTTAPGSVPSGKWWVRVVGRTGAVRVTAGEKTELLAVVDNPDLLRDRNLVAFDKGRVDGIDLGPVKLRKTGGALAGWKLYGRPEAGDPQPVVPSFERTVEALTERRTIKAFPAANPANFSGPELKATVKIWADGFESPKSGDKTDDKADTKTDEKAEPKEKGKPVVLEFGKKEGDTIHVRRTDTNGNQAYFLLPEKVKVGSAAEPVDLLEAVTRTRLDLLDPNLQTFAPDSATRIVVSGEANYELAKDEKPDPAGEVRWRFAAPAAQSGQTVDGPALTDLLNLLGTQSVTRFIEEAPAPEKLADYGLGPVVGRAAQPGDPPAPRLKAVVVLKETDPANKERTYEFGKEAGDGSLVYARQAGRPVVFTVPRRLYDKLKDTSDLRDKSVFRIDFKEVAKIELTGWGDKLGSPSKLALGKKPDGSWEVLEGPSKYPVDAQKVTAFLNALSDARVKSFTTDKQGPDDKHKFNDGKQLFDVVLSNAAGGHHLYLRLGGPADPTGTAVYALTNRLPADQPICTVDAALLKTYKEGPGVFAK